MMKKIILASAFVALLSGTIYAASLPNNVEVEPVKSVQSFDNLPEPMTVSDNKVMAEPIESPEIKTQVINTDNTEVPTETPVYLSETYFTTKARNIIEQKWSSYPASVTTGRAGIMAVLTNTFRKNFTLITESNLESVVNTCMETLGNVTTKEIVYYIENGCSI